MAAGRRTRGWLGAGLFLASALAAGPGCEDPVGRLGEGAACHGSSECGAGLVCDFYQDPPRCTPSGGFPIDDGDADVVDAPAEVTPDDGAPIDAPAPPPVDAPPPPVDAADVDGTV